MGGTELVCGRPASPLAHLVTTHPSLGGLAALPLSRQAIRYATRERRRPRRGMRRALSAVAVAGALTRGATRPGPRGSGGCRDRSHRRHRRRGSPRRPESCSIHSGSPPAGSAPRSTRRAVIMSTLTVEGDARWFFGVRGFRTLLGVALFPQRFSFHGLYVHPTFEWDRSTEGGVVATAVGGGVTVGYAWTWIAGAVRPARRRHRVCERDRPRRPAAFALGGLRPEVDAISDGCSRLTVDWMARGGLF